MNKNDCCVYQYKKNNFFDYVEILIILILIFVLYNLFNIFDIHLYFPYINSDNISIFLAFLTGLFASISTCGILNSAIVISFNNIISKKEDIIKYNLYFNIGRLLSFFIFGFLLGVLGMYFKSSTYFNSIFIIIIGILIFIIALNILKIINIKNKSIFFDYIKDNITYITNKGIYIIFLVGFLTFFIPCGFTQSVQLIAISTQDPLYSAFIMLSFAIGSTPILLFIGFSSRYINCLHNDFVHKLFGSILLFLSLYLINSGIILIGNQFTFFNNYSQNKDDALLYNINNSGVQIIQMNVDNDFYPNEFYVKKDIPVRFEIKGINVNNCVNEVVIPLLNINTKIEKDKISVIEFIPKELGVIPFSCWMGMINGKIIVVE